MNRKTTTLTAAMFAAAALAIAPAAAQNMPPPGNVNPGSLNSGAEESGAPNQPRSYIPYYYGGATYDSPGIYVAPGLNNYGSYGTGDYGGANAIGAED